MKTAGFDTDVLIVGAGPTGLTLALVLQRAGVATLIVDKLSRAQNTSRAAVIHAHTLEELAELGVAEALEHEGLKLRRFSLRDRDRRLVSLRFDQLPSAHAHLLMLTQDVTERILRDHLAAAGRQVGWNCAVESLKELGDGVEATLATPEGRQTLRARYVVGADGVSSLVRKTAGIAFSGESYEDSFVLADVSMNWNQGRDEVMLFFSPAGMLVVAPLPSGQFLLVGDAAHAHSPAGGQGMNTGIVDACVLGKLLTGVLKDGRDDSYLDHYQALRRPAAQQVLDLAGRLTTMATVRSPAGRRARNLALGLVGRLPPMRRKLQLQLSGISRRKAARIPAAL